MSLKGIVFDAYGTLFDVYSVARLADEIFPGRGAALAQLWRERQIDYSRLRTMSDRYKPFSEVTRDALCYACAALGLALDAVTEERLIGQYQRLDAFPENRASLASLRAQGFVLGILSNGDATMLGEVIEFNGLTEVFDHVLSADSVRRFKTAPEVYALAPAAYGAPAEALLFVSSNCWDACGAAWYGYQSFWINRQNAKEDVLDAKLTATGSSMSDVVRWIDDRRA